MSAAARQACELLWDEGLGYGYLPPPTDPLVIYDDAYCARYEMLDATTSGLLLTSLRVNMVGRHLIGPATLIDVGVGGCAFVREATAALSTTGVRVFGYDVAPRAVAALRAVGEWADPLDFEDSLRGPDALAFWDSLEHVRDPALLVERAARLVFVSTPVYRDRAHARASKHCKPGEHLWYWSDWGLIRWFGRLGFELLEASRAEESAGREGIGSYAFRRRNAA